MSKELSPKQSRFAEIYASGRPAGRAYEEAGYKVKGDQADSNAARLLGNGKMKGNAMVMDYIKELREKSTTTAVKTAQDVKEGLSRLLTTAEGKDDYSGYTQLANRLAKMDGHDEPEKVNHAHSFFDNIPTDNGLGRS